mgnify:FL=1
MTKVIKRRIKVSKFNFQLEIYPNLEGHKEVSWEVFPETYKWSLYAFSNKEKLNKIIEDKHIYEPKKTKSS